MAHLVVATEKEQLLTETLEALGKSGIPIRSTTSWAGLLAAMTDSDCVMGLVDGGLRDLNPELLKSLLESLGRDTRLRSIGVEIPGMKRSPQSASALTRLVARYAERVLERDTLPELSLMGLGEHPFAHLSRVSQQELPIQIQGEQGSNKEGVARAIHALGGVNRRFIKRAPGQVKKFRGKTGTVYLKRLEEWTAEDLNTIHSLAENSWRIIAGTRNAESASAKTWIQVQMLPLRDRKADIEPLTRLYISRYRKRFQLNQRRFDKSMWALMQAYNWPKNHKELENFVVQVLTRVHQRTIRAEALPPIVRRRIEPESPLLELTEGFESVVEARLRPLVARVEPGARVPLHKISVQATERALIRLMLARTGGDQKAAAELLGIARNTFRAKAEAYGLLGKRRRR
ncbi:MAG: helix-turn-helix domain-containing protein [Myxococcota bacterium]|nr:helix-turn-helix domain-containing protein [Myxococcota bacterium]